MSDSQEDADLRRLRDERDALRAQLRAEQRRLRDWAHWIDTLEDTLRDILSSSSWRIGKPVRVLRYLLRRDIAQARSTLHSEPDPLSSPQRPFAGKASSNVPTRIPPPPALPWRGLRWPAAPAATPTTFWQSAAPTPASAWLGDVVALDADADWSAIIAQSAPLLIHVHVHTADGIDLLARHRDHLPADATVAVSAPDPDTLATAAALLAAEQTQLAPTALFGLAALLADNTERPGLLLHLQTNHSGGDPATAADIDAAWSSLLGDAQRRQRIDALFAANPTLGLLATQPPADWPDWQQAWLNLRGLGEHWAGKLGIESLPTGRFAFPRPALFLARMTALQRLRQIAGHAPKTAPALHDAALARLLPTLVDSEQLRSATLADPHTPGWSPHRIEQTLLAGHDRLQRAIADPLVRTVAFDIFDTLVTRPLLDAERIKQLVAANAGDDAGQRYLRHRAAAEHQARADAGRDIELVAIHEVLAQRADIDADTAERLSQLEEQLERHSCAARPGAQALIDHAIRHGKRVVLISDMFLSAASIRQLLADAGIRGWQALYLSSEIGVRKDSGLLYQHVLEQEALPPAALLMIGDNEYADAAVPASLGIRQQTVVRPADLARSLPRLGALLDARHPSDLDRALTLGTVVRGVFGAVQIDSVEPDALLRGRPWEIGYGVLGPLLHWQAHWLLQRARSDGVERLFFLAREGELLKAAFEHYWQGHADLPDCRYLLVSRRAVSVASIDSHDDIRAIAATTCEPTSVADFVAHRFGVMLTQDMLPPGWRVDQTISVNGGDASALATLLQALDAPIRARTAAERPALLRYLANSGLHNAGDCAVVDIGYSASIQDYLNRLCGGGIHGYYLATTERARRVAERHGVRVVGGLAHDLVDDGPPHPLHHGSFHLEKLLSSDTTQLVHHQFVDNTTDSAGTTAVFLPRHADERAGQGVRHAIRAGAFAYLDAARDVSDRLLPNHAPPADLVIDLYRALITDPSPDEQAILGTLVLDDHYCGRGLVR